MEGLASHPLVREDLAWLGGYPVSLASAPHTLRLICTEISSPKRQVAEDPSSAHLCPLQRAEWPWEVA